MNAGIMAAPMVMVHTTSGRGFTPEELAARCADKIVSVASTAPPEIRDQARAYKLQVSCVVARYLKEAIASDRTTVYAALKDAGHPELADLIRRL
jgi:post-segregation antitoxin (ccd killing protein)